MNLILRRIQQHPQLGDKPTKLRITAFERQFIEAKPRHASKLGDIGAQHLSHIATKRIPQ